MRMLLIAAAVVSFSAVSLALLADAQAGPSTTQSTKSKRGGFTDN